MTTPDPDPPETPAEETTKPEVKVPWWMYAIVLSIIGACALALWPKNHPPTGQEIRDDAKRVCQEKFIPARLKAPASADFSDVTVDVAGETYTVAGTVDSQNAFGAKVRATFACVMHSSGDQWVLDSANVDG